MININNFEDEDRYNLFRSVGELIHPVISKRNISDYNIILEEYLYPVRVYYPKKVSNIKKVISSNYISSDLGEKIIDLFQKNRGRFSILCLLFNERVFYGRITFANAFPPCGNAMPAQTMDLFSESGKKFLRFETRKRISAKKQYGTEEKR